MAPRITDEHFAQVWNNVKAYPTLRDISNETHYGYQAVKNRAAKIRRKFRDGVETPELVDRSGIVSQSVPVLPEMQYEFKGKMTAKDLLQTLRGVAIDYPEKNLTRMFFRNETGIADSTWNRYFGTFLEFKRQAGLEMNRNQHAVERQIAKHVSADHYRTYNERHEYGDRYNRSNGNRVKVIVGVSDLHDVECDPFYLRVFIESCRVIQPDVINLGGDIFDLPEFGKFGVDPRDWDVVGRIRYVHEHILGPLREACPDTQIDFVEGNHEFRLLRHLADATPALKAVLSDLLGLTIPKLLGLDKYEINYIAKADMATFHKGDQKKEVEKSYVIYDDTILVHHHPHARNWGLSGWNGHHHHWRVFHAKHALKGAQQWLQLGCGHQLRASYTEGEFWSLGFNICHVNRNTKSVLHEYVNVTDMACVGGMYFYRKPHEMIGRYAELAA